MTANIRPNIALFGLLILVLLVSGSPGANDFQETSGDGPRPSDWHLVQRLYPHWRADGRVYAEAVRAARAMPARLSKRDIPAWSVLGPTDMAGRVVDIAHHPRNPDSVYAAAATGGVFLSTDAGMTWKPIFDDQPSLSIGDIAIDPVNPSVVYVGTGEANGGHNNLPGAGLFKSVDGGRTWTPAGLDNAVSIARVIVDPKNPDRVFAAVVGSYFAPGAERGLYRSFDAGRSWERVLGPGETVGVIDLVMHPENTDTLYAATWDRLRNFEVISLAGEESGVYRSYDGGDTWTRLGSETGFPEGSNIGRIGLTMCESQPSVLYAAVNDGNRYVGIYRTSDGGESWTDADPTGQARGVTSNFSWYFGQIRVSPDDPDEVYFLDVRMARTRNGGAAWSALSTGLHLDYHALEYVPGRPGRIMVGTDGGIGISTDDGFTWDEITGLPITQFYEVAVDDTDPDRIFGGTQDLGTLRRNPSSGSWDMALGSDGFAPLINPENPQIVYMQTQNGGLYKSTDGGDFSVNVSRGSNGIDASEPRNWSTPVAMDPTNPDILYYGTDRVYRSADAASTWEPVSPKLPQRSLSAPRLGTVTSIAISPSDPNFVYAGTDDGRFWATIDPRGVWMDRSEGLPERWLTEIAVDPVDPFTVYATFSGLKWDDPVPHVFKSSDGGVSWANISGNLPDAPVNAVVVDPADPSLVFVGSDIGVFVTENGGASWAALSDGMPVTAVYDLDIHNDSRKLYASTHGRSIFETTLPLLQVTTEDGRLPSEPEISIVTWPNPFSTELSIGITGMPRDQGRWAGSAAIQIVDVNGRQVRSLPIRGVANSAVVKWDGRTDRGLQAPAGVYFVVLHEDVSGAGASSVRSVVHLPND